MTFFYFELKRFIKNPKNIICLLLLVLLFGGLFAFEQISFSKTALEMNLANARLNLEQVKQSVANSEKDLQLHPDEKELAQKLAAAQEDEKSMSEQVSALERQDFEKFAELDYQYKLSQIKSTPQGSQEYKNLEQKINYYQAVKAVGGQASPSVNDASEAAFFTARSIKSWLSSTVVLIIFTVLLADSISSEIESSQIRFYQLLGGRKLKQLLLKLAVSILVTFLTVILSFTGIYVVKGLTGSFGTWHYPYLANDSLLPSWQLVSNSLLFLLLTLLFLASLGQLLSLIFKKSLVVIGLIVVALTGFMTLAQEEWFLPFKKFFPLEYLGYGQLLNDAEILPKNAFIIGIFYLLGLSIFFILLANYLYQIYYYRKAGKR